MGGQAGGRRRADARTLAAEPTPHSLTPARRPEAWMGNPTLAANDMAHAVFRLTPASASSGAGVPAGERVDPRAVSQLGCLRVRWCCPWGDVAELVSPPVVRQLPPRQEVEVEVAAPSAVDMGTPFQCEVTVANRSARRLQLMLYVRRDRMSGVAVCGKSTINLGVVDPRTSARRSFALVPTLAGLLSLRGFGVRETASNRDFVPTTAPDVHVLATSTPVEE